MAPPGTNTQGEAVPKTLPLFRPEAMAAQGNLHGEILLIRPLSVGFLLWLGIGLGTATLGFLFLGNTTETAHVTGVLLPREAADSAALPQAGLDVPSSLAPFVKVGTTLVIRCPACSDPLKKLNGKIVRIENAAASPTRVILALPSEQLGLWSSEKVAGSVVLEAEIPLGRTSLIHWLLKPSPR